VEMLQVKMETKHCRLRMLGRCRRYLLHKCMGILVLPLQTVKNSQAARGIGVHSSDRLPERTDTPHLETEDGMIEFILHVLTALVPVGP
jgi:hypothetical protein